MLYQHGARTYLYAVISPEENCSSKQTHEITSTRPRLQLDDKGNPSLVGGSPALQATTTVPLQPNLMLMFPGNEIAG